MDKAAPAQTECIPLPVQKLQQSRYEEVHSVRVLVHKEGQPPKKVHHSCMPRQGDDSVHNSHMPRK